jgi:hypothetical protein
MDTQKWGPDGWDLLHSIAYYYEKENNENKERYKSLKSFFYSIQHILPCIYCRRSYKKYISEVPIKKDTNFFEWIYIIHNKVNDKLKEQGYNSKPNPSYNTIYKTYQKIFKNKCNTMGWNFLYSIIFNYDEGISDTRKKAYLTFFNHLGNFLPSSNKKYNEYLSIYPLEKFMDRREDSSKWLYLLEKHLKGRCCEYEYRCKKIEKYRVRQCVGQTCRSI